MRPQIVKLSNGFEVIFLENKNSDIVSLSLVGRAGSSLEDAPGTAHFLEHVTLNGSVKLPSMDTLTALITSSGGVYNAQTGKELVKFVTKTISQEIEKAFEFLSQAVFYPLIRNSDVEKERKIILQEIARAESDNSRQLFESLMKLTYNSKPLNRMVLGNSSSIKRIKVDDLKKFWQKYYIPSNFVLCVAGKTDVEEVKRLSERYFGTVKGGVNSSKLINHQIRGSAGIDILKRDSAHQTRIMISYPAPLPSDLNNHFTALLISYILGRGQTSRLFKRIREELNLAYDISSWVTRGIGFNMFYIQAGVSPTTVNKTIAEIANELKKLIDKPLTSQELSRVKKQFKSYMLFNFENSLNYTSFHAILHHSFPSLRSYKDELKEVNKITASNVQMTAKRLFIQKPNTSVLTKKLDRSEVKIEPLLFTG